MFVSAESGRRFDDDDVLLAEDLARRAAVAVDNARLYSERAQIARTLQDSLLPPQLPTIPGVEVAARYVAAGEGIEVGGDFYDLFDLGTGDWSVVMGDVCGKGADAAALTALARYTLRATADRGDAAEPGAPDAERRGAAPARRRPLHHRRLRAARRPTATAART